MLDGEDVAFTMGVRSVSAKAMWRHPRACIGGDDENPRYAYVMVGLVTLSDDLAPMLPYATAIGASYMGAERAEEFGPPQCRIRRASGAAQGDRRGHRDEHCRLNRRR